MVNAPLRLQLRMGKIEKLSMDSGTNLIELKRMSEISNCLLKFKEVVVHPVNSQYRNHCERPVRMMKKVIRMMMRKLPVLLREEAVLFMETACYTINKIPYAADGGK